MSALSESLRGYAVSLAVLVVIGAGLFALVSSQHSGTPSDASSAGGSQTLAAAAARAAKLSAQSSAAQAAFDRQVAEESAHAAQQDAALGAQDGRGVPRRAGSSVSQVASVSRAGASAGGAVSAGGSASGSVSGSAPLSSAPVNNVTAGAGASTATKLTGTEVQAAVNGGAALARECADVRRPDWAAAERDLNSAVYGERALEHALRKDPETVYQGAGTGALTMRKFATSVAVPANLKVGGGCQVLTQNILNALNGVPN